jgi:hypothetical protein
MELTKIKYFFFKLCVAKLNAFVFLAIFGSIWTQFRSEQQEICPKFVSNVKKVFVLGLSFYRKFTGKSVN